MDLRKLQRLVVDALDDVKAQDVAVFDTTTLSDLFDRVVLASGTSNRHTRALAWRVAEQVKQAGGNVLSVEGDDVGEWVLVDLGDLILHVMLPAIREYYQLEEIWGGKRVRLKSTAYKVASASPSLPEDEGPGLQPAGATGSRATPKRARKSSSRAAAQDLGDRDDAALADAVALRAEQKRERLRRGAAGKSPGRTLARSVAKPTSGRASSVTAKPARPARPAKSAKSAKSTRPAKSARPAKAAKRAKAVKPAGTARTPAKLARPPRAAKSGRAANPARRVARGGTSVKSGARATARPAAASRSSRAAKSPARRRSS